MKNIDGDFLFDLVILRGLPQHKIGKIIGCSQSMAGKLLKQYDILRPELLDKRDQYFRKKMDKGYVLIYCPDHPRAERKGKRSGFVKKHILVMENSLGRYLVEHERVHHLNGIKTDNRIKNLFLCNNRSHKKLHCQLEALAMKMVCDGRIVFRDGKYIEKN